MLRKGGYQTNFVYSDEIYSRLIDKNSLLLMKKSKICVVKITEGHQYRPLSCTKQPYYKDLRDCQMKKWSVLLKEDTSFDHSTISIFRKRLGAKRFESIFQKMLEQIKQKGVLDDYKTQIIDSMPVLAKAALPSTTALIYGSIKCCIKSVKDEAKKKEILSLLEMDDKKLEHYSKARPLFKIQDNVVLEDELVTEREDKPPKTVKSPVDKDAKLGHKSKDEMLFGYKHNVSITENGFITATTTTTMADKDDEQFAPIVSKQIDVGLKAERVKGDRAYGNPYNFIEADAMGIELEAPLRKGRCEEGFNWYDFTLSFQLKHACLVH